MEGEGEEPGKRAVRGAREVGEKLCELKWKGCESL